LLLSPSIRHLINPPRFSGSNESITEKKKKKKAPKRFALETSGTGATATATASELPETASALESGSDRKPRRE